MPNQGYTYSTDGEPGTTDTVLVRKFTARPGYTFKKAPSINLLGVTNKKDYTYTIQDTGSIADGDLTARKFIVKYKYPEKPIQIDTISFTAKAEKDNIVSTGKIYGYKLNGSTVIGINGGIRKIIVYGDPDTVFTRAVTNTGDDILASADATIGSDGTKELDVVFPKSAVAATYSFILTEKVVGSFTDTAPTSGSTTETFTQGSTITTTITLVESGDTTWVLEADETSFPIVQQSNTAVGPYMLTWTATHAANISLDGIWNASDFVDAAGGDAPTITSSDDGGTWAKDGTSIEFAGAKISIDNDGEEGNPRVVMSILITDLFVTTNSKTLNLNINDILNHA